MSINEELRFSLGARLRLAREKAGLTPEQMAEEMAMSVSSIKNWELGYATPTPRKIRRWASIVAQTGDYTVAEVLDFLDIISVEQAAERRRVERRAPPRQPRDGSTCFPSVKILAAA
jgi:transcriptional regulator with XRE-family HTH domain